MSGEPVTCPACGGTFEGPVTLPDGTVLRGHVQGGPFCHPVRVVRRQRPPLAVVPDEPMTDEQRELRAEAVRASLRADRSWRRP